MNAILINKNPAISRLISLSLQKLNITYKEINNLEELESCDIIIADNECEVDIKLCQQMSKKLILILAKNETSNDAIVIHKPFLPTDFIDLINSFKDELKEDFNTSDLDNIDLLSDDIDLEEFKIDNITDLDSLDLNDFGNSLGLETKLDLDNTDELNSIDDFNIDSIEELDNLNNNELLQDLDSSNDLTSLDDELLQDLENLDDVDNKFSEELDNIEELDNLNNDESTQGLDDINDELDENLSTLDDLNSLDNELDTKLSDFNEDENLNNDELSQDLDISNDLTSLDDELPQDLDDINDELSQDLDTLSDTENLDELSNAIVLEEDLKTTKDIDDLEENLNNDLNLDDLNNIDEFSLPESFEELSRDYQDLLQDDIDFTSSNDLEEDINNSYEDDNFKDLEDDLNTEITNDFDVVTGDLDVAEDMKDDFIDSGLEEEFEDVKEGLNVNNNLEVIQDNELGSLAAFDDIKDDIEDIQEIVGDEKVSDFDDLNEIEIKKALGEEVVELLDNNEDIKEKNNDFTNRIEANVDDDISEVSENVTKAVNQAIINSTKGTKNRIKDINISINISFKD